MATRVEIRKRPHYVNNKEFLEALSEYKKSVKLSEQNGERPPVVPDYIALCFMKIAKGLASRPNFSGYAFLEDMIGDGIENSFRYMHNFDPEKSSNPFAYFTRIIYNAFIRKIGIEKKHLYTKYKAIQHANMYGETSDSQSHDSTTKFDSDIKYSEGAEDNMNDFIKNYEEAKKKKK